MYWNLLGSLKRSLTRLLNCSRGQRYYGLLWHKNRSIKKKKQWNLFRDPEGIWRCGGRLQHARLKYNSKFPILLIGSHYLTTLLIRRAHQRVFHNGTKETLNELRARYWIIKGRTVVRQVIHHCNLCRRLEAQSYRIPPPPPVPSFRVQEQPRFTFTVVDFAGPLYLKEGNKV